MAQQGGFRQKRLPTTEEIARYGHITAVLRLYIETFGLRPVDLAKMVWPELAPNAVYPWLSGYAAPTGNRRAALADFMGVSIAHVTPREPDGPPPPRLPNANGLRPPPTANAPAVTTAEPTEITVHRDNAWNPLRDGAVMGRERKPAPWGADVLGFRLHPNGTVTITLNVNLPAKHGWALLRTLSDAGLETYYEEQEHEP